MSAKVTCTVHKVLHEVQLGDGTKLQYRVVSWNSGRPRFEVAHPYLNQDGKQRCRLQKGLDWEVLMWLQREGLEQAIDTIAEVAEKRG